LNNLQLSIIPQDYVDEVMNSQYCNYKFPESYESIVMSDINFSSIINESCELLNIYLRKQPSMHILWEQFINDITYCVNPKSLSCLLNCYIQNGIEDISDYSARKNGLSATRLFFLASTFKGSTNIGFFHSYILTKCLELIKLCVVMLNNSDDVENRDKTFDEDKKKDLISDLLAIIRDIGIMVKRFQFSDEISSLNLIIDIMVDVTRLEVFGNILEQLPSEIISYGTLAFNAYSVLLDMFNENCGTTFDISKNIMYHLLPGLLIDEQRKMHLSNKKFNVVRDHHLSFVCKLTKKLGASFDGTLEILLHHLLNRGPDRSELKPRQFQIILEIWRLCSNNVRIKIKFYILTLVYNVDAKIRAVALETLFKLLSEPEETESDDPDLLQLMPATKHEFIVAVILSKFQDSLLTVRAKAFSLFAALTAGPPSATAHQTALVKRVLVDPYLEVEDLKESSFSKKYFFEFYPYVKNNMADFDQNNIKNSIIYPGSNILLWVLNVHAHDERAHIRRLSVTLLCNVFRTNIKFLQIPFLKLLVHSCSDCAITIRKVIVSGLTDLLLKYPNNQNVLKYWFKGLIHLVGDRDKKIQELAIECMNRVILQNIKPYSAKLINDKDPIDCLPWLVLDNALNEPVGKYMMCLCEKWHINGFLTATIIKDIITYIDSPNNEWNVHSLYLIQLISHQVTIKDILPIFTYFNMNFDSWFSNDLDLAKQNILQTNAQMVIDILFLNQQCLDKDIKLWLLNKFEDLVLNFKIPIRLISKSLDLYIVLLSDNRQQLNKNFNTLFFTICNSIETSPIVNNEEMLMRYIYTLGDIGLLQHFKVAHKFQKYLLGYLKGNDQSISSAFQTIVVLTIGKLSIVDEQFAKDAIAAFGEVLKNPNYHPSTKINALTALADLCLRCSTLVEQAIPEMCVCLKAENITVKRAALKLLTGLILEDYIKLRNIVFFALLCMLEDSDHQVREETSSFIVNYLLIKNKNIMERKLVEVIFHFNGYLGVRACPVEDCFTKGDMKAYFSMEGDLKRSSRHCVYRFMLTHMMDENKLKLTVKIFKIFDEIIKEVKTTDNNEVKECARQVMKDSIWILKAKEMALTSGKPRDSNNDDDPETIEKVVDFAKNEVILKTYQTVISDYVIPGVFKIKYELEKNKKMLPTVMNDLLAYLCVLTSGKSPIKQHIIDLLSSDSDLLTEILHENKKLKQHKQQPGIESDVGECDSEDNDDEEKKNQHLLTEIGYVFWQVSASA
jgi:condensin-2 complex subunit D3